MSKLTDFDAWFQASFSAHVIGTEGDSWWDQFVNDQRTDLKVLISALEPLAERYAEAVMEMRPASKLIPSLAVARRAYFAELDRRRKEARDRRIGDSDCAICGGAGLVLVLAPRRDDVEKREFWPADWRTCPREDLGSVETAPCPQCGHAKYSPELRNHIEKCCVPLTVRKGTMHYPPWGKASEYPGAWILNSRIANWEDRLK